MNPKSSYGATKQAGSSQSPKQDSCEGKSLDLSVVIVSANHRRLLEGALSSLYRNGSGATFETIVVDNCSVDGTKEMVVSRFPMVKLIESELPQGFSANNNTGIRASVGRYILLMNPDIEVLPGALSTLVSFMDRHPDAGIAGAKLLNPDLTLQYSCRTFSTPLILLIRGLYLDGIFSKSKTIRDYLMLDWEHNSVREVDWVLGACMVARREAVADVGLMDENFVLYFEDQDWCYRMWDAGWKVYYVPEAQMVHHYERKSAKRFLSKSTRMHVRSMLRFFCKYRFRLPRCRTGLGRT